ncbi:DUF2891 domain-containing protein [Sphingomonas antarctica]|uniref:DUF2891 domain-containing protein n=1 Tax=Sphingomonas antarctica TaxID=2040274 RepID=UPI0039E89EAA
MLSGFAEITLGHIGREWPYAPNAVLAGPEDLVAPRAHHPIFYGSFDWHSCVHSWWQLLTIRRLEPDGPAAARIGELATARFTADNVAGEVAYLLRPASTGFARPYGLAWALALHGEACRHAEGWGATLEPLARTIAARLTDYFGKLTYPIRVGTHFNSSFAMILSLEWARTYDPALAATIERRAREWFGEDRACQAWEPGGDEFLSPVLTEALLMSHVLPAADFAAWFDAFLPDAEWGQPVTLFTPAHVSDRSDGKIAHLDGLNLSRAWAWRSIARVLGEGHAVSGVALGAAERHVAASLPHIADDYMGSHWLPSFALLAVGVG